ncbi:MAG: molybdate ABC transporter permease subunit [Coriobacteriales bacterium]
MIALFLALALAWLLASASAPLAALADSDSGVVNSNEDAATSIKTDDSAFGLSDVTRNQIGMNKTYQGKSYGYVFPLGKTASSHFSVVVTKSSIVVYVPADMAQAAGFDISDSSQQEQYEQMIESLDEELSDGGTTLSSLSVPYKFTSDKTYRQGKLTLSFDTEIESGYYYVCCKASGNAEAKSLARFCLSGQVKEASQIEVADEGSWLDQLKTFLDPNSFDYRPLWVSLKTAGVAMVFIFLLGIWAARKSMHVKSRWKGLLDSLFTIPMVLPPTVVGFILLVIFGNSTAFGRFLLAHGIKLIFSWPAAVLAATIVGFPLMYRTVLGAFESLDNNMLDAARTLGWSEGRVFRKLMLPLAWPSIAAGTVLAFARAMGEFGATLFVAGNYAGVTQTIPIAIYFAWMGGSSDVAIFWVIVVILISFLIILIINVYTAHVQRFRKAGGKGAGDVLITDTKSEESGFAIDEGIAAELGFDYTGKRGAPEHHHLPSDDDGPAAEDRLADKGESGEEDA